MTIYIIDTMELNLESLQAFSVFAETLNFTRAAEQLYISQPALHIRIKKLGQQLGVQLYSKNGKRLTLTPHGKMVANFARQTEQSVQLFVQEISGVQTSSRVCLAAGQGSYLYCLGQAIAEFKRKSKAKLQLLTTNAPGTLEAVRTGKAQLGFTVLDAKPSDLKSVHVLTFPMMLVVDKASELATRKSISIRQLNGLDLIVPHSGRPHRTMVNRLLEMKNISWNVAVEADGWELAIQFSKLGLGAAIVNGCCDLPRGLVGIPFSDFPPIKYYLVTKRKSKLTSDQKLLFALINSAV